MLKVRCKGFEGKLNSMTICNEWDAETREFVAKGTYLVSVELDNDTEINLQNVKAEEIEIFDE